MKSSPKCVIKLIGIAIAGCICLGYFFLLPSAILSRVNDIQRSVPDDYDDWAANTNWPKTEQWRRRFSEAELGRMSVLGKWLFQSTESSEMPQPRDGSDGREYLILVWKHGAFLERRHIKHFTNETFSPWDNCSVKNCRLSYESEDARSADAVLIHLHKTESVEDLPLDVSLGKRMSQRWVFLTDESPLHTFLKGNQRLSNYNGIFNWSMTYRTDSDVPVPYGRTLKIENPDGGDGTENILHNKTKLVAVMGSNCVAGNNRRWDYVRRLKEKLGDRLDIYGHCLGGDRTSCPGHFTRDCPQLGSYKFYLAFENSNCREYITEKPFWHGYSKGSVPVIMGASREDCGKLLPPRSFIHVEDFANPNTLADYLLYLEKTPTEYVKFHAWRDYFRVVNEHGYFQTASRHYCRLCEALNYNEPSPKVYEDLELFWSAINDCR